MEKKLSILALLLLLCLPADPAGASTVTDALGRRVDVPEPESISRILALGCSMGFITSLGAQDMVLAVEDIDKAPLAKPYIIANRDRFRDLPVVGKAGAALGFGAKAHVVVHGHADHAGAQHEDSQASPPLSRVIRVTSGM